MCRLPSATRAASCRATSRGARLVARCGAPLMQSYRARVRTARSFSRCRSVRMTIESLSLPQDDIRALPLPQQLNYAKPDCANGTETAGLSLPFPIRLLPSYLFHSLSRSSSWCEILPSLSLPQDDIRVASASSTTVLREPGLCGLYGNGRIVSFSFQSGRCRHIRSIRFRVVRRAQHD